MQMPARFPRYDKLMLRRLIPIVLCGLCACHTPVIVPPSASKPKLPERNPRTDALKKFAELAAGAQLQRGFFEIYQKEGQVYLTIPKGQLNKEFLLATHIDRGAGTLSLIAGGRLRIRLCEFHRRGDTIYLLQRSSYFSTATGSSWEQSVEQSYANTVLESAKIEAIRPDGAVLIPIQGWLTSDLTNAVGRVQSELKLGKALRPPDRNRSFVESVRAFPDNVNFSVLLTFSPTEDPSHPFLADGDGRYLPVGISYTLARLPAVPMLPRLADDRIGLRVVTRREPGNVLEPIMRFAYRWRISSGHPLTFYLDPSIPLEYRPFVMAGITAWNRALAAAGLENAIQAKPLPSGTDLGDLRYPTVRWGTQLAARINGLTSDVVDPRTGEILGSTIVLDGDRLVDDRLLRLMLILQGRLRPNQPLPVEFVAQMIKKTTMHEVGHALGLEHNFAATLATSVEKLADANWVREHGVASSVMDYPALNLPPSLKAALERDFPIYNQDIGPTDIWAIRYAYQPDEQSIRELARTAAQNGHRYAWHTWDSDEEDPDPTVTRHDLGGDPLEWMRQRMQLLREMLAALPGPLPGDDGRAVMLTEMVEEVVLSYVQTARFATRYLGGYQVFYDHAGDPGQRPSSVPIAKTRQKDALNLLAEAVFREDVLPISPKLREQLGLGRFHRRIQDPVPEFLNIVPHRVLEALTAPSLLGRLRAAEVRFGSEATVTTAELFDSLDRMLFAETGRPLSLLRRDLQSEYVGYLASFVLDPPSQLPQDARALAREHLNLLQKRLLAARGGDVTSAAHRHDLAVRIGAVLDARLLWRNP